jgi:hypothetical protein
MLVDEEHALVVDRDDEAVMELRDRADLMMRKLRNLGCPDITFS